MCSSSDTECREIDNNDNLVCGDIYIEDTIRERDENDGKSVHEILRRLANNNVFHELPLSEIGDEVVSLGKIACPIVMTTLLLFSRSVISMLFLGHLGKVELAGGSLALGFGNITGISVIKGLAMGMDPICGQAYGAKRWSVLSQTYQKMLCLLLLVSIPISILWLNVENIFLRLGQDPELTKVAKVYIAFSIPELLAQAILHPMRTFLRAQGLTSPLTLLAIGAVLLHPLVNYLFVIHFKFGVKGVAIALASNTINLNIGLVIYVFMSKTALKPWHGVTVRSMFQGWRPLLALSLPSVVSVCLEWWWYEIMLFLCGLLRDPNASVAAMGILIQTTGVLYIFPFAISSSLSTRVGQALGAGQPSRAQMTAILGLVLAFACGLSFSVFMSVLKSVWGKLFTNETHILELISSALPILGLCELGNCPQTAACGVLTGTARPKDGARINLYSFYFVGLPVAITLTFYFKVGFRGLWFGLLSAQLTCLCMMVYTLFRTDWKLQAKRAEELTLAAGAKDESRREDKSDLETGLLNDDDTP